MAAGGDNLQDIVERILPLFTLDELKGIATHLGIANMDAVENPRVVLRNVQEHFDRLEGDSRDAVLRGLPVPEGKYTRLLPSLSR